MSQRRYSTSVTINQNTNRNDSYHTSMILHDRTLDWDSWRQQNDELIMATMYLWRSYILFLSRASQRFKIGIRIIESGLIFELLHCWPATQYLLKTFHCITKRDKMFLLQYVLNCSSDNSKQLRSTSARNVAIKTCHATFFRVCEERYLQNLWFGCSTPATCYSFRRLRSSGVNR